MVEVGRAEKAVAAPWIGRESLTLTEPESRTVVLLAIEESSVEWWCLLLPPVFDDGVGVGIEVTSVSFRISQDSATSLVGAVESAVLVLVSVLARPEVLEIDEECLDPWR